VDAGKLRVRRKDPSGCNSRPINGHQFDLMPNQTKAGTAPEDNVEKDLSGIFSRFDQCAAVRKASASRHRSGQTSEALYVRQVTEQEDRRPGYPHYRRSASRRSKVVKLWCLAAVRRRPSRSRVGPSLPSSSINRISPVPLSRFPCPTRYTNTDEMTRLVRRRSSCP